jgi:hypothetical protein
MALLNPGKTEWQLGIDGRLLVNGYLLLVNGHWSMVYCSLNNTATGNSVV